MDGLSSPYFRGFELRQQTEFLPAQQIAIAQSIQQVLETTPEGFNSFEFQFDFHRVYLHKLNQGITLLVLTSNQLAHQRYTQSVRRLLLELQIDQANPVFEFREIALEMSLLPPVPLRALDLRPLPSQPAEQPKVSEPISSGSVVLRLVEPRKPEIQQSEPQQPEPQQDLKDVLAAINELSQLTTQYLGTMVVSNYWKATRPPIDWLNQFQVERSAQMTYSVQRPSERLPILTTEQYRSLQTWVMFFIERCSQVVRDFAKIVRRSLNQSQVALLFNTVS